MVSCGAWDPASRRVDNYKNKTISVSEQKSEEEVIEKVSQGKQEETKIHLAVAGEQGVNITQSKSMTIIEFEKESFRSKDGKVLISRKIFINIRFLNYCADLTKYFITMCREFFTKYFYFSGAGFNQCG